MVKLGRTAVKPQLEALYNLGIIDKEVILETIGNKDQYVAYYIRLI